MYGWVRPNRSLEPARVGNASARRLSQADMNSLDIAPPPAFSFAYGRARGHQMISRPAWDGKVRPWQLEENTCAHLSKLSFINRRANGASHPTNSDRTAATAERVNMATQEAAKGPASYFPSIEKKYGKPIDHWMRVLGQAGPLKHMELVGQLKAQHQMGHGHANALVAWFLARK